MTKNSYKAAPGVEWVNGQRVPKNGIIELTAAEAAFDLGYARIDLTASKPAAPVDTKSADKADTAGKARL